MAYLKKTVWDYLFYLSMTVCWLWLLLKSFGVIKTPFWLEYGVPFGGLLLGFIMFYQTLIDKNERILEKIFKLSENDMRVESKIEKINAKIEHLDKDVEFLKSRA